MTNSIQERLEQWKVDELLLTYPGLSLRPIVNGSVRLAGLLSFRAEANGLERIEDAYEVEIMVPTGFPRDLPTVTETAGRVPKHFHTNHDGSLCLGSPLRQHLELAKASTLPGFLERCVVPFLYGFSYREKYGRLPFGELAHGTDGLREDFAALFGVNDERAAEQMVRFAGMKKREANKLSCPCGSGRRLGKCHNGHVNQLRAQLGRVWCRWQYRCLTAR